MDGCDGCMNDGAKCRNDPHGEPITVPCKDHHPEILGEHARVRLDRLICGGCGKRVCSHFRYQPHFGDLVFTCPTPGQNVTYTAVEPRRDAIPPLTVG